MLTKDALEKTARMLAGEYRLSVITDSDDCACDLRTRTIRLPSLPKALLAESEHAVAQLLRYYLDHHVARFAAKTSHRVLASVEADHGQDAVTILNCLEDIRAEAVLGEEHPGCLINTVRGVAMLHEMRLRSGKDSLSESVQAALSLYWSYYRLTPKPPCVSRCVASVVQPHVDRVRSIPTWATSTRSLVALALEIAGTLRPAAPVHTTAADVSEMNIFWGLWNEAGAAGGGFMPQAKHDDIISEAIAPPVITPTVIDRAMRAMIKMPLTVRIGRYNSSVPTLWPCFMREFDSIARTYGGAMRQRLHQVLLSERRVRWRGDLLSGSCDPARMKDLATGLSTRVMRRRVLHQAPGTACYLLVDGSGSMAKGKATHAMLTACAFASVLSSCGHESMIAMYTSMATENTRTCLVRTLKTWSQGYAQCRDLCAAAIGLCGGGTPTGRAMYMAANALAKRDARRRVLLVITDGEASDREAAKSAPAAIERDGIEVVLIGIGDTARVDRYHTKTATVANATSLSTATMEQLRLALTPKRRVA